MIEIRQTQDGYEAQVQIATAYGPVIVRSMAPTAWVDEAVRRVRERHPAASMVSGDFFSDIGKAFNDVAKSRVFSDITNVVQQVASNPLTQMAASAIGGPGAGVAVSTIGSLAGAAHSLAEKARRGDPQADRDVRHIAHRARRGDKRAALVGRLLKESFQAQEAKDKVRPAMRLPPRQPPPPPPPPPPAPQDAAEFPMAAFVDFNEYRRQVPAESAPSWASWG